MKFRRELFLLFALPYLNGCETLTSRADVLCTMEARPALQVNAVDAQTGKSILSGATVIVQDGQFVDSVQVSDSMAGSIGLAHERSGRYEVIIRKSGYKSWSQKEVQVKKGECHVEPVKVEARLEKQSN